MANIMCYDLRAAYGQCRWIQRIAIESDNRLIVDGRRFSAV